MLLVTLTTRCAVVGDSVLPAQDEALPGADSTGPRGASSGGAKWMGVVRFAREGGVF